MTKIRWFHGLFALLIVFSFIYLCAHADARKTVVAFKSDNTNVSYESSDDVAGVLKPTDFLFPTLIGGVIDTKEFLAVISTANVGSSSQSGFHGVARTRYGDHNQWSKAEVFTNKDVNDKKHIHLGAVTSVMKGNKIYCLAHSRGIQGSQNTADKSTDSWDNLLFVGTVKNSSDSAAEGSSITWEAGKPLKATLAERLNNINATYFRGAAGNGIVTKKGEIIFPICIDQPDKKNASSILYSTDNGTTWILGEKTEIGTYDGSVVEWEEGKLLFSVLSDSGYYQVFESGDVGSKWKESLMFSQVWGNNPERKKYGFPGSSIKVPVDEEDVLLFAHPLNKKDRYSPDTLQLWLSDGQRIICVGTISEKDKEQYSGSSIMAHVGDHLYITHEINPMEYSYSCDTRPGQWDYVIGFTSLPEFFESAQKIVRAWRQLDIKYKTDGIPTEALVGFLENSKAGDNVWADMYNCVNATVTGGTSVDGGFQFNGAAGSAAKWPVISQGQNQVYKFTEKQFTLAATVKVHSTTKDEDVSLLGAIGDDKGDDVLIGVGYTKDMKWYLMHKSNKKIVTGVSVNLKKEYHVTITFVNKTVSVYVDGVEISNGEQATLEKATINHFFMGGTGVSPAQTNGNLCTVKNVMLFNRVLTQNEITNLTNLKNKNEIKEETTKANEGHLPQNPEDNSEVPPSRDKEGHELTPKNNPTIVQGNENTISATKDKSTTKSVNSMPTKEPKEASGITTQKSTNERDQNKKLNNALHGIGDAVLKYDANGDNDAAVSLSAVASMCFVCSLISLMGF